MKYGPLIFLGCLLGAAGVWQFWPKSENSEPSVSGGGVTESQRADSPRLSSQLSGGLPIYDRPLDDFPEVLEEGHGDLSPKGLLRLWKELHFGDLPAYIKPVQGYYRARIDT